MYEKQKQDAYVSVYSFDSNIVTVLLRRENVYVHEIFRV